MSRPVSLGDGVRIETASGTVAADASSPDADVAVCSHAHSDHLPRSDCGPTVCSPLTADLADARYGRNVEATAHPDVTLLPAGHVAGSRAALVDDGDTRVLYTGDVCTRDRLYLDGFDPPEADLLVVEATYGHPDYSFPAHDELEREILEWLEETIDRPVLLHGYALGRAQKLQRLVAGSDRDRCFVTEDVAAVNAPIEAALGVDFGTEPLDPAELSGDGAVEFGPGDAVVLPAHGGTRSLVSDLVEETGALRAGFSGWAVDSSFRYRGGYDATFPLTDHCDFEELLALVEAVDPEVTYTQHGFADELARQLARRGYEAWSLERDQTALTDFC